MEIITTTAALAVVVAAVAVVAAAVLVVVVEGAVVGVVLTPVFLIAICTQRLQYTHKDQSNLRHLNLHQIETVVAVAVAVVAVMTIIIQYLIGVSINSLKTEIN